jgi:class 3 adenylate cyclase/tetratricopeptide (TPR) repeat protein
VTTCPNCGEENSERARFCQACGAALQPAPPAALEERKTVSVLFVDLVGFTARSDAADPEDVRATLAPYHARLKSEIERFGGTVEKFIGDAVMAVFGAPTAHEDDAERAVRASLRILAAIEELNAEHPGLDLAVRAAVNTGEAVVSLTARPEAGEGIVTGDVVNTASRLQNAAPTNSVVVGEQTFRSTRDQIVYEPLDPVAVKGKSEPIPIWRAVEARSRYGVDVTTRAPTPFIGREPELSLLQDVYHRTLRDSSPQLLTVTGEPGVGKTRLLTEFRAFVDDRPEIVYWRQGRCLPYGEGITFWALGEVVKAQAGILESDSPDQARAKLHQAVEAVVPEAAERDWLAARLAHLIGLSAPEEAAPERAEAFTAWRRFLEAVAVTRPLICIYEDLHWADGAMLEFVEHLVDWAVDVPILLLCSARPELYERHPGWGGGKRNSTTISLGPLSTEETARLISELLSEAVLPAETQGALLERSGGNPLYAEEFVRMLLDRGILVRRGRALELTTQDVPVPETVGAIIAARLDTLSPERKALLQDASVIGKVFWSGAVATMGATEEAAVREGLQELVRKELVRPSRTSSVAGHAEYSFWHLLVRDVAYAQIPRAARARKHRAAAAWIESIARERVTDHAELLAHHHTEALELARASGAPGQEVKELEDEARRFLVMAGERAEVLDLDRAAAYYHRALELAPVGERERARVLRKLAETTVHTGRLDEAAGYAEEAVESFRKLGDRVGAGEAMRWLGGIHWRRGGTSAGSWDMLEEAIALLEQEPPGPELADAYSSKASAHMMAGRAEETLEWSAKALDLARELGHDRVRMRTLQWRGFARFSVGDLGGIEDLRESVRMGLEMELPVASVASAYNNLGDLVWLNEGPARGLEVHRTAIEFAERRGAVDSAMWTRAETTWMLYDSGEWDELLRVAEQVLAWDLGRGITQVTALVLPRKALVLAHRGREAGAADIVAEMLPRAREITDAQVLFPSLGAAAYVEHARGNAAAAAELAREYFEATADRLGWRSSFLTELVPGLIAAGELALADELVREVEFRSPRDENAALSAGAMLAEARGDMEEALDGHERAAAGWAEFGHALKRATALLGQGRCLLTLGRPAEATGPLTEARETLTGLGAVKLLAETDAALERATRLSS